MKRIGNLYQQVISFENCYLAFKKAFQGARKSEQSLQFYFNLEHELKKLIDELRTKSYHPAPYRYFTIYDPKEREIAVAPFRDRVVHHAIVNVLEPIYERCFIFDSYATRKNKGTHKAILRAQHFLRRNQWFLKADIQKYFFSIDHDILMEILKRKIKDKDLLWLLEKIIRHGGVKNKGIPIGNLTSQFLANVYLDPFDHFLKQRLHINYYIRYMDDFVIFSKDKSFLKALRSEIEHYLGNNLLLRLKEKSVIINQRIHGLGFLGARIYPKTIRIRSENLKRSLKKYQRRIRQFQSGALEEADLQRSLDSIIGYLSFFDSYELRKHLFGAGAEQAPTV